MLLRRHILGAALALPIAGGAGLATYDALVPPVVITKQTPKYSLVKAGADLIIKFDIIRKRSCPAIVNQWIFDGVGIQFEIEPLLLPPRVPGVDEVTLSIPVPASAAPGRARYQMTFTHDCAVVDGWWHSEHPVTLPYVPFVIEPSVQVSQPEAQQMKAPE